MMKLKILLSMKTSFSDKLMNSKIINFTQVPKSEIELIKNNFSESSYYVIIEIENDEQINIISEKQK